jgi:hypothetical protein
MRLPPRCRIKWRKHFADELYMPHVHGVSEPMKIITKIISREGKSTKHFANILF